MSLRLLSQIADFISSALMRLEGHWAKGFAFRRSFSLSSIIQEQRMLSSHMQVLAGRVRTTDAVPGDESFSQGQTIGVWAVIEMFHDRYCTRFVTFLFGIILSRCSRTGRVKWNQSLSDGALTEVSMDSTPRKLIYVCRHASMSLTSNLEGRNWEVTLLTPQPRKHTPCDHSVLGGLLDFSTCQLPKDFSAIEDLLVKTSAGWVATVVASQVEDETVRRLIREYCFDYVTLPVSDERIINVVGHAYGMASLHDRASNDSSVADAEGQMIGSCDAMRALYRCVRKVATTDAPVFISGESGTGKELTAVAIHERSARSGQPFVAINCGAVAPHLLQSELFGYERGAFTGANLRKIGRVEAANGGTLFLDEIGDLPLESQASLLRFLQERKIERLGGHGSTPVDVRIISATHVDMERAMMEGHFRADLYHRLCVLQIVEPPLRARGPDIGLLAKHMLDRFRKDASRRLRGFSPDASAAIYNYSWPGNVRELLNRVRRAIVMSEGRQITASDLELADYAEVKPISLGEARQAAERHAIEVALLRHRGRLSDTARELEISRVTLYRLLTAHGLRAPATEADNPEREILARGASLMDPPVSVGLPADAA
jgi:DNA-binding NtrC family response regulator